MRGAHLPLVLLLAVAAWLAVPGVTHADSRLTTLAVKGMVCQA